MAYTEEMWKKEELDPFFMGSLRPATQSYDPQDLATFCPATVELESPCPGCGEPAQWYYTSGVLNARITCKNDCGTPRTLLR